MTSATFLRWIHLVHRWTGITLGPLVLLWFVSGIVMIFVPRPLLTAEERLAGLPPIKAPDIKISPLDAWKTLGLPDWPEAVQLNAPDGRATYHFLSGARWFSVHADDGSPIATLVAEQARRAVSGYAGKSKITALVPVERDQWTLITRFDAWRPFLRVELDDGRHYYVSARTGEIVLDTARDERAWNWVGTFIHWLYFSELRQNFKLWRAVILWTSFGATLMAGAGFYLGIQRLRITRPYPGGRFSPYRDKWKLWHHWSGLIGSVFLLAWLLSGWLSLAPMGWAQGSSPSPEERQRLAGGALDARVLEKTPALDIQTRQTREIQWIRFGASPKILLSDDNGARRAGFDGDFSRIEPPLALEAIVSRAGVLKPGHRIVRAEWLHEPDTYYFPHRHRPLRFPVARLHFDDEEKTVYYIDPVKAGIEAKIDRSGRWQRWLFKALHRFDFPPFDRSETARIVVLTLASLLGIVLTFSGCVMGWKRLER
jgi:uncharacterized iron-regulated membrane protein